ncbi:MAG: DegT/DnrJ/EryC1/StrS family aminotransferase [Lentisphaeria bacterium]|nr:DegT/DnrJ/EryC1/StrS family aminotransferase [Lentisphaeria bacterium]
MDKSKLAINGGSKAVDSLPKRFHFGKEEKAAADALFDRCIETGNAIGYNGAQEEAFGKEFAEYLGGGFADGVNAGTNAVYVALKSLQLPPFSEVVVGCVTDPGGMMPIVELNCIPVPADTEPGSMNAGAKEIEARITERTSAIVVAHIAGEPADMPGILKVAEKYDLPVVEDCAQAHMALINGRKCGTFGTCGAFSLMFGKHMCVGGQGGAVFTKDEEQYWKIRRAADRGKPFNLEGCTNVLSAINCNMDELHAAIGRAQLKKLPGIVERRLAFVQMMYDRGFDKLPGIYLPQKDLRDGFQSCYWWWRLRFVPEEMNCTREEFVAAVAAEGVTVNPNYRAALPARQMWYADRAARHPWNNPLYKGDAAMEYATPNCDKVMETDFQFFMFESYGEAEADKIMNAFKKVSDAYCK